MERIKLPSRRKSNSDTFICPIKCNELPTAAKERGRRNYFCMLICVLSLCVLAILKGRRRSRKGRRVRLASMQKWRRKDERRDDDVTKE